MTKSSEISISKSILTKMNSGKIFSHHLRLEVITPQLLQNHSEDSNQLVESQIQQVSMTLVVD